MGSRWTRAVVRGRRTWHRSVHREAIDEHAVATAIQDLAQRLAAASGLEVKYLPDTENRDMAYPFFRVEGDEIVYRAYERGQPLFERRTTSLDEFLEWVFSDVTREMASSWELAHRVEGQDARRLEFPKWIQLMSLLSPEWGDGVRRYVDEVLLRAPYDDRPWQGWRSRP